MAAKAKKEEACCDMDKMHKMHKCMGMKIVILGVLIILNAYYKWFDWAVFTGGILVIAGLIKLIMPCMKK